MRPPKNFRNLTDDEITVARQVFVNTVHYGQVLISDGLGYDDRPFTVPTNMPVPFFRAVKYDVPIPGGRRIPGKYVIHAGPACFAGMNDSQDNRETLVHELTHVWQGEHSTWSWGYVIMSGKDQALAGDAAYDYYVDRQHKERLLPWEFYGPEQQAKIVEDWYHDGMQSFDPIARTGDKRFYYIKRHIRGEDTGFDWLPEPLQPLDRATLKVPPAFKSAAKVAEEALAMLDQPIAAKDAKALAQRIVRLAELFRSPGPADARALLAQLERTNAKDKLAQAFHHRLATATRAKLLQVLKTTAAGR